MHDPSLSAKPAMSPDSALRLARCFDASPGFWMNLQTAHDLAAARSRLDPSAVPSRAA